MFDFRKSLYGNAASSASADIYVPRFGGAYADIRLPLSVDSGSKFCIILVIAAILYSGFLTMQDFGSVIDHMNTTSSGTVYLLGMRALLFLNIAVFLWRILLVMGYKPAPTLADSKLPRCTVIIPAYNEGKCVLKTLRSVLKSDYPIEKLQIITVNDGSKDDTLMWMQQACDNADGRIELINFTRNRGKRAALYDAIKISKGSIIVTIDSDSIIDRHTLRRLVSPFIDPQVGAVAGNVRVLNRREGIIPKMLEVSFAFSFDFIRASQSMVNSVFCTPGALSAYRKKAISKDLKQWLEQTFFSKPATIGEDRAITNIVLRNGYHVRFQSNSVVYTIVPTCYKQLCKMYLRWARSNVRETFVMAKFIFKKFRKGSRIGAWINFFMSSISMLLPQAAVSAFLATAFFDPQVYISQVAFGTILASTLPTAFYIIRRRSSDALWAYAYGLFWMAALWWITMWALITMGNGKWLTRDMPADSRQTIAARIINFLRAA
ncbi:MAG: Poly-beta-1,6-N-acetyl-D-glucosamine synthase [Planctomycetes bacterium ADurb.Bin401]|nr:MAG: Poly-beta-1,6-N-acetyl-D-glucosamine synthase [Planctomycetes bacterium ADurb.Bin401]